MRSGRLRHRITIQKPTAGAADDYGAALDAWADFATIWADVQDVYGDEAVRAAQVHPEATIKVLTRYRSDVTEDMRISFDGRTLYPVALIPDVRKTSLWWYCKEER